MTKPKSGSGSKKKPASSKPASMTDVAHPDTSAPPDTSKPIITHRPMIKDPMMVEGGKVPDEEQATGTAPISKAGETKLTPIDEKPDDKKAGQRDGKPADDPNPDDGPDKTPGGKQADDEEERPQEADGGDIAEDGQGKDQEGNQDKQESTDAEGKGAKSKPKPKADQAAADSEEDPAVRKLIESKKYFLPINAVEHRRSARFAAVGIILALVLAAAWVDVALDAGLIHISGLKPVTHLFSN